MSLRRKIMAAVILLVFIPVIAMGAVTYLIYAEKARQQLDDLRRISLQKGQRNLRTVQDELARVSHSLVTEPLVQRLLTDSRALAEWDRDEFRLFEDHLNSLLFWHPDMDALYLYNHSELVYARNAAAPVSLTQVRQQDWYFAAVERKGKVLWLGTEHSKIWRTDMPRITLVRAVLDLYTLEEIGFLALTIRTEAAAAVLQEIAQDIGGRALLVDSAGMLLAGESARSEAWHEPICPRESGTPSAEWIHLQADTVVVCMPPVWEDWRLAALFATDDILAETSAIRHLAFVLLAGALVSVVLFDWLFIRKLVMTIIAVVRAMKEAEKGSFRPIREAGIAEKDESGQLIRGFNRMSFQITELLKRVEDEQERKKQAEQQALMAQINPHFIYNSLESINSMAVIKGNMEISDMAVSLGRLLRISISEPQELIPLSKEIEHVKHYLFIQTYRYEDKLDFSIELPPQLQSYLTVKLIIQPLVENSLIHGIDPLHRKGVIRIRAFELGERDLCIEVADNGAGIDNERMAELFQPVEKPDPARRGLGLLNVHERLRLHFGSGYGVMMCSEIYRETIVRIRMPKL